MSIESRRPLRILRIITRMNIGGPAVHAALLSAKLDTTRFSTCLVVGQPDDTEGDLSRSVEQSTVRLLRLQTLRRPIHPWADLLATLRLMRIAWRERPHIIHTHMAKAGALGRLAGISYNTLGPGRRPGARALLVHTFHGHVLEGYFSPWLSRCFLAIERWLAARTDCLIAVSQAIRNDLLSKRIGHPEQWRVIPLGLDLSTLADLPIPNGSTPMRCGMVSRLVPVKNPGLFLQAMHRLVQQPGGPSLSGVIVGDGPLRMILERETQRLGLDALVRFTGWQQDLRSVYEELEVACVTSWNEGTPVSLIEAMAAGRAVVATDVGGVRDLLDARAASPPPIPTGQFHIADRGLLVRAGDAEGLAAALGTLAHDAALRRKLGATARAYVLHVFRSERLLHDISALYERLPREAGLPCRS